KIIELFIIISEKNSLCKTTSPFFDKYKSNKNIFKKFHNFSKFQKMTKFITFSQIFSTQIHHIQIFLIRARFSIKSYSKHKLQINSKYLIYQTLINWIVLSFLILISFHYFTYFEEFAVCVAKASKINNYDVLIWTSIF